MSKEYKYILFDVDDTLLDFKKAERRAFDITADEFGLRHNDKIYSAYTEINDSLWKEFQLGRIVQRELVVVRFDRTFKMFGIDADPAGFNSRYLDNLGDQAIPFDDSYDSCLRLSGKYDLYMITNAVAKVQRSRLSKCTLTPLFKDTFISEELGYAKPSEKYFDEVGKRIAGFDRDITLVVGDSPSSDLEGAVRYGMDCCYVNRRGKPLPESMQPDYVVNDLYELCDLLI